MSQDTIDHQWLWLVDKSELNGRHIVLRHMEEPSDKRDRKLNAAASGARAIEKWVERDLLPFTNALPELCLLFGPRAGLILFNNKSMNDKNSRLIDINSRLITVLDKPVIDNLRRPTWQPVGTQIKKRNRKADEEDKWRQWFNLDAGWHVRSEI